MRLIAKPETDECAQYVWEKYIALVPDDGRVLEFLQDEAMHTAALARSFPPERLSYRYAEGKWTVKEIIGHLIDDERIYTYRALRFARGDATELPGFEQDDYASMSGSDARDIEALLAEFTAVRIATIALFASFDDDALLRRGVSDGSVMSVRAIAYHIAGHERRHANIIRERYR